MSYVNTVIVADETKTADADLVLPRTVIRKFKLPTTLTVEFGNHSMSATVKGKDGGGITLVSPEIARSLHLPTGVPILLRYSVKQRSLVIGPFIGILLSQHKQTNSTHPFGMYTPFLNEVADVCHARGGVVCAFSFEDVNWESHTLRGMIRKNGIWQMRTLPLPQCIYNRLSSRQEENSNQAAILIEQCRAQQIPFFNQQFLNKWQVHKVSTSGQEALSFLPKTERYSSVQELKQLLQEFPRVYVKPTNGSMGKGIFRITRSQSGYVLSSASGLKSKHKDLPSLQQALNKRIAGKSYIVQQGLPLIGINQRPVDFRALVQKKQRGEWGITSLVARVGQNQIVSNVARGGRIMSAAQALRLCGPWQVAVRPSVNTLKSVALQIASRLESLLPGHYAEFGIDLGVDVRGRIWLLEVNSKPSKSETSLQMQEGEEPPPRRVRPSVRRLVEYATFLGGFRKPTLNVKRPTQIKKTKRR